MPRAALPASPRRAPRWRRQPEARPAQILDAALIEFGERGLAHARLDDVARRAGVAKGTIYLYFPTKDALFRAMVRHIAGRTLAAFELKVAKHPDAPARDQIRRYITELWTHVRTPAFGILHRLTIGELPEFPDLLRFFVQETSERGLALCARILRRGVERGEFRDLDPDATARMIHAIIIKHGVWFASRAQIPFVARTSPDRALREMLDFIDHALRPAPASPRRPRRRAHA